jgi:CHAD domain-containing protein
VREHVEREQKLVPEDGFRLSDLGPPQRPRVFTSTYYDTPDLRLARHGITLRHRIEDGTRLWQLKIPTGSARIELEAPGPPARPPAELTDLLAVHLRDWSLEKVARLRTRRETVSVDGAEIVEDAVSVFDGPRVVDRFRELEVELLDGGDERSLRRAERSLRAAGARPARFVPKLHRALGLGPEPEQARAKEGATPGEALGAALAEQGRRLVAHDPGTRLGADPEDLHQMRVATRRARAFLRAARELVEEEWAGTLRSELGWLGSALGPARDADVLLEHVRGTVEALGERGSGVNALLSALERERKRARARAVAALSEDRYFLLLDLLEQAAHPRLLPGQPPDLAGLWWDEVRRTRRAFSRLGSKPSDEELHAARIRVKRARYAAELAAYELGERGARFVGATKKLQDVLGEHQDSVVAETWITGWSSRRSADAELAGRLVIGERKRRRKARSAWPEAWDRVLRRAREARP